MIFRAYGDDTEDMERVVADLSDHVGQQVAVRVVDRESGGWGHINFDDFRLHETRPSVLHAAGRITSMSSLTPVSARSKPPAR